MTTRHALAAALVLVLSGCAQPPALSLSEECRLGAWLALHVAKEAPPLSIPSPDKPDQGDTCEECNGTGQLGAEAFEAAELKQEAVDRAARLEAKAAAAAKAAPPPASPLIERYAVPPKDGRTYRKVCRGGVCSWEPVP